MNIIEGLQTEMNRCRELLKVYDEIHAGVFAGTMIRQDILNAEKAIVGETFYYEFSRRIK